MMGMHYITFGPFFIKHKHFLDISQSVGLMLTLKSWMFDFPCHVYDLYMKKLILLGEVSLCSPPPCKF